MFLTGRAAILDFQKLARLTGGVSNLGLLYLWYIVQAEGLGRNSLISYETGTSSLVCCLADARQQLYSSLKKIMS